ncbi:MAG: hypothetical protein LBG92_03580 [Prevotellaceae bacterium]|jgi:hypothetical protein|nr:hypothetical protein [Prevotellaceae bacterium]
MILLKKYKNRALAGMIFGLIACLPLACIKDKGNYDYHDVNSVTISGIENSYFVPLGQPLKITPTLTFSVSETKDSFKYEWHLLGGSYNSSAGVLSSERNLDIIVGKPITKDGDYNIVYCVTNKTTGIRYDYRFRLQVRDRMLNGYIMLCERENNSFDIDLISIYNDTLTQYHNVLDIYNSQMPRTDRKPLDIVCYNDYPSPKLGAPSDWRKYAVWILTDKGTERVRVENFEWQPDFDISGLSVIPEKYLQGEKLIAEKMSAPVAGLSTTAGVNYIYYKGNWFWYNWPGGRSYLYLFPVNAASPTSEPYKTSPYIFTYATRAALFFNEDANRFEWQNSNSSGNSSAALCTKRFSADNEYFNWENPDYRLIYMDNRDYVSGFAVVKNVSSGKYEFLQMMVQGLNQSPKKLGQAEFPAGLDMESVKFYAYHNSLPYLFCATEDRLYRINTTVMQQWDDVTSSVLTSGHKISKVKSSAIRFAGSNRIIVATYDPSGQAGINGQLALYNVQDGTGDLTLAKHPSSPTPDGYQIDMKWTGFGKIINVDYKEPK